MNILVFGLIGYIIYNQKTLNSKINTIIRITNKSESSNVNVSLKDKEKIFDILNSNYTIDLINHQNNNIYDIKSFLEKNNDEVLKNSLISLSNDYESKQELSIENVNLKVTELYGYDLNLKYNDIYDINGIAYKYDTNAKKYYKSETAFAYGAYDFSYFYYINNIEKSNNIYDIKCNIIWSNKHSTGDEFDLFGSYKDANNNENSLLSYENVEQCFSESSKYTIPECLFEKKGLIKKSSTYKIKMSIDSDVKIISFEKV